MDVNRTILVCQNPHSYGYKDVWHLGNPLDSPTSLLFVQLSLITMLSQCIEVCLKPLGQSSLVSQILGGVIFGPSVLGQKKSLANALFPMKGAMVLETLASFGLMFFFFIVTVKMDLATMLRTEKQAISIGLSTFLITLVISGGLSFVLKKYVSMDKSLSEALPVIAMSQAMTVFIVVSVLLTELKILNTDIGRLAMSSAMSADIGSFSLIVIIFAKLENKGGNIVSLVWIILSIAALIVLIIYVMRPAVIWMLKRSEGKPVDEFYIVCILIFVLMAGFLSELIGQHFVMGPILLGLAIPEGPPMGTALMAKMETICHGFFYPIYLAVSGLKTNVFRISFRSFWVVGVVVFVSSIAKIGAVMLPGYYSNNMSMKECCMIGLILNARGIAELTLYNMWKGSKLLTEQEFSLMVVSILLVNAIISPLLKMLYDPSEQYHSIGRCTILHTRRDSELRVMICIHNNENIPTLMNIIEASYASRESMVGVIALILVELLGRARPLLVAHQEHDTLRSEPCSSTQIENALKQYAQQNEGYASVQSFSSTSNFETMHDDVCRIALDKRANILIMPFHKRWEIDGTVQVMNRAMQIMNARVLEKAPCSVGILVDRGILCGSSSLLVSRTTYHVAVFFIGGADDAEALAYSSRMARHEIVHVTLVRFLLFGEENSKERKRDSDLVDEYRYYNAGNRHFEVMDEVVKDGIEMSCCIRRIIDYFDLVMVGREHPECVLLQGHDQWSECPELGTIGDMLASQDFVTKASLLVVQQQRVRGRVVNKNTTTNNNNPFPIQKDQMMMVNDVVLLPHDELNRASCSISVVDR
ncbi:hypothetical protein PIB30_047864 [Stylosanthes scabra]|uniref:Cation/H+ exchanger domain-containing protein n=1 Tax=Stylosanthes scabra TaxID=79078 RepID=A0ABU6VFP6_9FABA|nr:hypothetical protein [Stylosanthes scabra]